MTHLNLHRSWVRVSDFRKWSIGFDQSRIGQTVLSVRVYSPEGKKFPRLVLVLCKDNTMPNAIIAVASYKDNRNSWWKDVSVPSCLAWEMAEMWKEVSFLTAGEKEGT